MIKNRPLVSLGMPVYNGENYINEAIDSILAQTFTDFVLIISDNASEDKTQEICEEYARQDERILYYRNDRNVGAAANFNRVFELSDSKYFKWASHDDRIAPDFLEKAVNVMESNPDVALCYAKTLTINEFTNSQEKLPYSLKLMDEKPARRFAKFMKVFRFDTLFCDPIMGLMRSSVFAETKLLGKYQSSDMVLLSEIALRGKFYEIDEHIYIKRVHPLMSRKKNPTLESVAEWFDPSNKGKIQMPRWKWFFEYLNAIADSPVGGKERLLCYYEIYKWFVIRSKSMAVDVLRVFSQLYSRSSARRTRLKGAH
ncbi:MAG: glycosyltransferase family 2 protein [Syntrophothermus sp.]